MYLNAYTNVNVRCESTLTPQMESFVVFSRIFLQDERALWGPVSRLDWILLGNEGTNPLLQTYRGTAWTWPPVKSMEYLHTCLYFETLQPSLAKVLFTLSESEHEFFVGLCRCSMWTLKYILCEVMSLLHSLQYKWNLIPMKAMQWCRCFLDHTN